MSQTAIQADDVAAFLQHNPTFFLEHEYLLLSLKLPHPRTAKVLSLPERQTLYLQQHNQQLKQERQQFLTIARENELIQQALWLWAGDLLAYQGTAEHLARFACERLQVRYGLQEVQLRLWWDNYPYATQSTDAVTQDLIAQQPKPYAGTTQHPAAQWFEGTWASMAVIPLYAPNASRSIGALALGSDIANRFTARMGTDFLEIMAQVIVASLARFYDSHPSHS
ncbi:hypothetical protein PAEH1_10475 [Paenalcaligenes hominis]|uniref:DUF484 domain-containing protein n=1 Tax=Paenalcaligenes hominis TaxID=643674 RepID=A0A1U9K1F4_9BURK|nr:DUF484 family protein [Paenalcaligenes hominis]AQS51871.1 hypothetical protein PAEH1_10475 [Paenalcaligenes hominis]